MSNLKNRTEEQSLNFYFDESGVLSSFAKNNWFLYGGFYYTNPKKFRKIIEGFTEYEKEIKDRFCKFEDGDFKNLFIFNKKRNDPSKGKSINEIRTLDYDDCMKYPLEIKASNIKDINLKETIFNIVFPSSIILVTSFFKETNIFKKHKILTYREISDITDIYKNKDEDKNKNNNDTDTKIKKDYNEITSQLESFNKKLNKNWEKIKNDTRKFKRDMLTHLVISTLNKILKEDKLQANKTCNINIYIDQAPENKKEEKEEGAEKDIKLESFIKKEIENLLNNNNVSMLPIQNVKVEYVNSKGKNPKNKSIRIADFIANISNYYLRDILNSLPKVLKCNNLKPLKYNKIKNFLCSIYNHTLIQKDYENLES